MAKLSCSDDIKLGDEIDSSGMFKLQLVFEWQDRGSQVASSKRIIVKTVHKLIELISVTELSRWCLLQIVDSFPDFCFISWVRHLAFIWVDTVNLIYWHCGLLIFYKFG